MKRMPGIVIIITAVLCNTAHAGELRAARGARITGIASWYSGMDPGIRRRTANRELFNDQKLTCAMWGIPFNTLVKVTNSANGKSVIVRVNDRGPAKELVEMGRVIDLTKEAFFRIADLEEGLITIELTILAHSQEQDLEGKALQLAALTRSHR